MREEEHGANKQSIGSGATKRKKGGKEEEGKRKSTKIMWKKKQKGRIVEKKTLLWRKPCCG